MFEATNSDDGLPARNWLRTLPAWVEMEEQLWDQGAPLPEPPPGYVFPVRAFEEVGVFLFEEEWLCNEMHVSFQPAPILPDLDNSHFNGAHCTDLCAEAYGKLYQQARNLMAHFGEYEDVPPPLVNFKRIDWEYLKDNIEVLRRAWVQCRVRRNAAIEFLCLRATEQKIGAVYRPKGGGKPELLPGEWWQLDSYLARFRTCGLNPNAPYNLYAERTAWFFFSKTDLNGMMTRAEFAEAFDESPPPLFEDDVHLSPFIRLMIEVAQLVRIGPAPHLQVPKESLKETIKEVGQLRGHELSERDVDAMATFIREPGMKRGLRTVLADANKSTRGRSEAPETGRLPRNGRHP